MKQKKPEAAVVESGVARHRFTGEAPTKKLNVSASSISKTMFSCFLQPVGECFPFLSSQLHYYNEVAWDEYLLGGKGYLEGSQS